MKTYCAFSFGAGVQSTAIALLIKHEPDLLLEVMGELPNKSYFADTQREMQITYDHLQQLIADDVFSEIPLEIVTNGDLGSNDFDGYKQNRSFLPLFTKNSDGSQGMLLRKCTSEFKIRPLTAAARRDAGLKKGQRGKRHSIHKWLGISTDEAHRMKKDPSPTFLNQYPLIELGWSRTKCFDYCQSHGYSPPKSRCYFCPYISDWGEIKRNHPEEFQRAVEFDHSIRDLTKQRVDQPCYLHRSLQPLEDAVENQGHIWEGYQPDGSLGDFADECEGMCGL